jgi:hypothetical protein
MAMHNDPEKTTALGLIRYAYEFFEAAVVVDEEIGHRPGFEIVAPIPAMYLVGHAIELTLKSYLVHCGVSLKGIRDLNHNLVACFEKAKELGLLNHATFEGPEEGAFEILNGLYSTKQLEYIITGQKHFPVWGLVEAFAARAFNAVAPLVGYKERLDGRVTL